MDSKQPYIVFIIGLLAIFACSWLPIESNDVLKHTVDKVVRSVLKDATEKTATKSPIKLIVTAEPPTLAQRYSNRIDGLVFEMLKKTESGMLPQFISDASGKELTIHLSKDPTYLNATLNWNSTKKEKKQRLGDWLSLLPPLIALLIALSFRRIIWALFLAVFCGGVVLNGGILLNAWIEVKSLFGALVGFFGISGPSVDGYIGSVLASSFNMLILGFTLALVGLVAVVNRMGGTRGLVNALSRFAKGPRSAQAVTASMGTAIFFDDYANTVVVGTTARSLTDRHRVSREKLAYIVDSTSAPVAGIAIISTWIGYEVGLFNDLLGSISSVPGMPGSGYELFFAILPFRFYCIFALILVILNAWSGRDLGPMYHAEKRARSGGPVIPPSDNGREKVPDALEKDGIPHRAINAIIPIGAVLLTILGCIVYAGSQQKGIDFGSLKGWQTAFEAASGYIEKILISGALVGSAVAILLAMFQRLLTFKESMIAYATGIKTLADAAAILILAWAIKDVCGNLGTGMTLVALVGDTFPPMALPFVIFVLSGIVAFSTGSSWATMALVLPIAAPLSASLSGDPLIVMACLAAVLDGAIWGDHCSPISDTTILSSTASGCPHLAHVKTQIPYAMLAMFAAGTVGYVGVTMGLSVGLSYLAGTAIMLGCLFIFGRNPEVSEEASPASNLG
jgi:Na+/H+ antiporter NhaC